MLVGRATRLARFIEGAEKRYDAQVRFGHSSDTDDSTGAMSDTAIPLEWPSDAEVDAARVSLLGRQMQVPPAYSAKHVAGTRSYALARAGHAVELPPVEVMVHALEVTSWTPPDLRLAATVGRGTYIRALARDLGVRLGIPAHCAELRRTSIGPFQVADAVGPDEVTASALLTPAQMLQHLPAEVVSADGVRELGFGRVLPQQSPSTGFGALLADDGRLVAVAEGRDGSWFPVVVLEPAA